MPAPAPTIERQTARPARPAHAPAAAAPEPVGGVLSDEFIAVLITTIATRLSRGSTEFYRRRWDIGMLEWRVLLVLERGAELNAGELAQVAGLDKAAVSRSLSLLQARELVTIEQTRSRGRASFASLTVRGRALCREVLRASRQRQLRLFKTFPKDDVEILATSLRRFAQALDDVGWDASRRRKKA